MRRDSATVVALAGRAPAGLLAGLAGSPNVSVVRPSAAEPSQGMAGSATGATGTTGTTGATGTTATRSGSRPRPAPAAPGDTDRPSWERGAQAMREAARRRSTYVLVPDDPLAGVAATWSAMWGLAGGSDAAAGFEQAAADALAAWRSKRFELPDYYLVIAPSADSTTGPDFYLGPLRAARPHRVAVAAAAGTGMDDAAAAASLLDTLRSLEHGPWWPSLDELLDAARGFYAGGLAETRPTPV